MELVNIRKANIDKKGYPDGLQEWLKEPKHIYIGRFNLYIPGATESKWKNPFSVKKFGREGCIAKFEEDLRNTPELCDSLDELNGKILGCWCYPEGCHGDVLMKCVKERQKK